MDEQQGFDYITPELLRPYFGKIWSSDGWPAGWRERSILMRYSGRVECQTAVSGGPSFLGEWVKVEKEGQRKQKKAKCHKKRPKRVHLGFLRAVQVGQTDPLLNLPLTCIAIYQYRSLQFLERSSDRFLLGRLRRCSPKNLSRAVRFTAGNRCWRSSSAEISRELHTSSMPPVHGIRWSEVGVRLKSTAWVQIIFETWGGWKRKLNT